MTNYYEETEEYVAQVTNYGDQDQTQKTITLEDFYERVDKSYRRLKDKLNERFNRLTTTFAIYSIIILLFSLASVVLLAVQLALANNRKFEINFIL